jgi:Stage II sporulation protein M/ABC-2 family transporter protein
MLASLRPVWVITRREVRDQFRDWRILFPIVVLTLFFPLLMNITAGELVNFVQRYGGQDIVYQRLIPFLLMVVGFFPITVSLVISLESFAGETERHSIEPLLGSPLADWQLYLGKLVACIIPALLASYMGVTVYLIGLQIQRLEWNAPALLIVQILILTAVQSLVMVSGAVIVSTQTTSVRAANLLSSFIIIPMALLMQVEAVIMFWGQYDVLWMAILAQVVIAILLIRAGIAHFSREELLGRSIDILNLKWAWRTFKTAFRGQAHSIGEWYRSEVSQALRKLLISIPITIFFLAVAVAVGVRLAANVPIEASGEMRTYLESLTTSSGEVVPVIGVISVLGVFVLWLFNLRGVFAAVILGVFSFGILGVLALMVTFIIMGFIAALLPQVGMPWWLYIEARILPHGVAEIPAIILAGAAILRMGVLMISPEKERTVGEAWLWAMGDWAKVTLGVVLPLFLIAAFLETFLTPQIAHLLLGP